MHSRGTVLGATIRFFARYAGIARPNATNGSNGSDKSAGFFLSDGGVGGVPDAIPDRLFRAWIADDVCGCEAFFVGGEWGPAPCGLPESGALPAFAFACACGLYFTRFGKAADFPEPDRQGVWLLFLQFQTVLRLVRAARMRGLRLPPVDVFGFGRYPETVRRLKACVGEPAPDVSGEGSGVPRCAVRCGLRSGAGTLFAPERTRPFRRPGVVQCGFQGGRGRFCGRSAICCTLGFEGYNPRLRYAGRYCF